MLRYPLPYLRVAVASRPPLRHHHSSNSPNAVAIFSHIPMPFELSEGILRYFVSNLGQFSALRRSPWVPVEAQVPNFKCQLNFWEYSEKKPMFMECVCVFSSSILNSIQSWRIFSESFRIQSHIQSFSQKFNHGEFSWNVLFRGKIQSHKNLQYKSKEIQSQRSFLESSSLHFFFCALLTSTRATIWCAYHKSRVE